MPGQCFLLVVHSTWWVPEVPVVVQCGAPGVLAWCSSGAEWRKGCPGRKLIGEGVLGTLGRGVQA